MNTKGGLHSFGTVKIPIKEGNHVELKSYLVDVSYRQFFSTINCIEGKFYNSNPRFKDKVGLDAGYYVCLTESGKKFAKTLLKRGFIEWTEENAKIYGNGFTCSSKITLQNLIEYHTIKELPGTIYMESVEKNQIDFDYDKEELESKGYILTLDTEMKTR